MAQLDPSISYSFWLQHPLARQRVLHTEPRLLLEGAIRWDSEGCYNMPLSDLSVLVPFPALQVLDSAILGNGPKSSPTLLQKLKKLDPLGLPIGGILLQHGTDRNARIYVPCMFMQRLDSIGQLEGDQLPQELEWLRLLVEQPNVPSAWHPPPALNSALAAFQVVSAALTSLINTLETYLPKLPNMTQQEVLDEAATLGDVGHFVFLLKGERTPYTNVRDFLKFGNQRRVRKFLATWWTKEHSKAPPRQSIQYSYK